MSLLTSPTTGRVTASFGMLGDIIIGEPNATIAFAGKRVIEEVMKIEVPEGVQVYEKRITIIGSFLFGLWNHFVLFFIMFCSFWFEDFISWNLIFSRTISNCTFFSMCSINL